VRGTNRDERPSCEVSRKTIWRHPLTRKTPKARLSKLDTEELASTVSMFVEKFVPALNIENTVNQLL
jgi:hypothetical protein